MTRAIVISGGEQLLLGDLEPLMGGDALITEQDFDGVELALPLLTESYEIIAHRMQAEV